MVRPDLQIYIPSMYTIASSKLLGLSKCINQQIIGGSNCCSNSVCALHMQRSSSRNLNTSNTMPYVRQTPSVATKLQVEQLIFRANSTLRMKSHILLLYCGYLSRTLTASTNSYLLVPRLLEGNLPQLMNALPYHDVTCCQ